MADAPLPPPGTTTDAFLFGLRTAATSVFAFVIIFTYIGFGAMCHDYGLSVGWAMLSTVLQWAGPAQVILVTGLGPGTALIETAVAVSLSSVRFLPIVVALIPLVRRENARPWHLMLPVHFMAVSVWVEAMRHAPNMPREQRIPFCNGVGLALLSLGTIFTAVGYYMQAVLPALFGAAAMFITPISFLTSTARNARLLLEKAALALGLTIGPMLAYSQVQFDLLWTGVIGGTLAYGLHRVHRSRSAKA
ncbi:MAG: branched-chain amino acid ABC transporter permease [Xanthobacteraceae bacterium]|nr:branched-chain amino acid ABC transporter permease [Xanthobacteraceae bacterium]